MAVTYDARTSAQQAAHEQLRELSRRNGKDIRDRHLQSHAIDVVLLREIGKGPVTTKAIVECVRNIFGMPITPTRVEDDLAYTSGTGEYSHRKETWTVLDKHNRVIELKEPRYPTATPAMAAFLDNDKADMRTQLAKTPSSTTNSLSSSTELVAEIDPFLLSTDIPDALAVEDAAQSGIQGLGQLKRAGRKVTRAQLELARQSASEAGRQGEEFVDRYFAQELECGRIESYEWESNVNPISPFDFWLNSAGARRKVEVKTTTGDFRQVLHISSAELREMQYGEEPYDLYRVYMLDGNRGCLRIAENVRVFAGRVLDSLSGLPKGVTIDSISVQPTHITFDKEVSIELPLNTAPSVR